MTCRDFEADIVDLARGAETNVAAGDRLRAHLEQCAACAARFEREGQLTAALKAMVDAEPPSAKASAIEAVLLAAFTERRAAASPQAPARWSALAVPALRTWLGAAAVLVLSAAVWQGVARWRSPDAARSAPARPAVVPAVAAAGGEVLRFVPLPTAIGLPALESGRIVRVALPTAILPAYGLDVTPDAAAGSVEADVLVGQDGQPRAIRFVTFDADPRRRQ
jgi:hypothetical protein